MNPSEYLKKGGLVLGLSVCAHVKGVKQFNALGHALNNAAFSLQKVIEISNDVPGLSSAVAYCMQNKMSPLPPWLVFLTQNEPMLELIGNSLSHNWPPDSKQKAASGMEGGLSALAIATCRNLDTIVAVKEMLENHGQRYYDLAQVASLIAPPGTPSRMRKRIKQLVKGQMDE